MRTRPRDTQPRDERLAKLRKPESRKGDDARWVAVQERDANRDGTFYYAVATTGVYCRPSCPSRRPK
ncbi:MAG: Ada metal-binding domain-containing protein, partial [Hyphomicrobium sp.]